MATCSETTVRSRIPNAGHSSHVDSEITKYVGHYSNSGPSKDLNPHPAEPQTAGSCPHAAGMFYADSGMVHAGSRMNSA